MDPIKVEAIKRWENPIDLKEVCSFLGFGNFYKAFIPHYSLVARPLHDLTRKGQQWHWGPMQQIAFNTLKHAFTTYPVLCNPDHNKQFVLDTDASAYAVGAILQQEYGDALLPIAFHSRSLSPAEKNYDIYDRELLAIIDAFKAFGYLLWGAQHTTLVRCDHNNLKYFKSLQNLTSRQARWKALLEDYDFELQYILGQANTIADLLSRSKDLKTGEDINSHMTLFPPHIFIKRIYIDDDIAKRRAILQEIHDMPSGGHLGIANTWDLVK
jgi:hypothetical protein